MSGVSIIGALLLADADVLAEVPAAQIKAWRLPDGVALPALLVRSPSGKERVELRRVGSVCRTERVSVALRAAAGRDVDPILKLVRDACAGKIGTIAGYDGVSITDGGMGPDLVGINDSYERTQDFMVSFNELV